MAQELERVSQPAAEPVTHALNLMGYLHAIRRRKSLMLLGLVIGFTLGALYYMRVPPVYESNAKILITNKNSDVLANQDTRYNIMEDQVANQISMIRSPLIAGAVADIVSANPEVQAAVQLFRNRDKAAISGAVLGGLTATRGDVRAGESTNVVILGYRCGNSQDCQAVLQDVLDAHKKVMAKAYQNQGEETVTLIKKMKDELAAQLEKAQKAYNEFRVNTLYVPSGRDGEHGGINGDHAALAEKSAFQTRLETLLMRKAEIDTHLKALELALESKHSKTALLAMAERFNSASGPSPTESPTSEALINLLGQEEEMAATYGKDYPPLKRVRAHIELLRRVLPVKKASLTQDAAADPLDRHMNELRDEAACNATLAKAYETLLQGQKNKLKGALQNELENERLYGDYMRTKQLWEAAVKKLQEVDLVKDMVGISAIQLAPPSYGRKVAPILSTCMSLSVFLGLLIGLGLVYLAEITDRSFKGPEDVVLRLGAPVIAHMPAIDYDKLVTAQDVDARTCLSPVLCVYHRPKSRDAEAIRGIRTAIFFANQTGTTKLIQFTSAQAGDGKSTLACNVALSIAQSGKRVIIVEADLRRPSFSNVFGKMPNVGFAQVLAGSDHWREALLTFPEAPNLAVLPCGDRPHNPAELLTGPLLAETLEEMKAEYDYVIIDTPPLLPVTDPCSVAAHADGIILVVQMGRNTRPNAERAGSLLETLGVRLLGVVMNRMTKDGGYGYGYGYGGYGYNYGGRYKYGGYAYRTDTGYYARNDAYYEEDGDGYLNGSEPPVNGKSS